MDFNTVQKFYSLIIENQKINLYIQNTWFLDTQKPKILYHGKHGLQQNWWTKVLTKANELKTKCVSALYFGKSKNLIKKMVNESVVNSILYFQILNTVRTISHIFITYQELNLYFQYKIIMTDHTTI